MSDESPMIDRGSPTMVWVQVANAIATRIADGTLRSGDPLPSERAILGQYGVSYGTVRSALRALRERGLIETSQGKGTFVL